MKKVIPPILFLLCILLMVVLHYSYPIHSYLQNPFNLLGIVLLVVGFAVTIKVRKQFSKIKTEIHTFKAPQKLVTSGLFRWSRNPIYFGFATSLFGVAIILGSVSPLLILAIFIVITNYWYIPYEEKVMEEKFGVEYLNYKSGVRRWI